MLRALSLLLLLLFSSVHCLDEKHEIQISRCKQDNGVFCFAPAYCTTTTGPTPDALQRVEETAIIEKDCDVFMMLRRYTLSKVRVHLWAPSISARFRIDGGKIAFGCEANVEKRVEGQSTKNELTILRSELDEQGIFCDLMVVANGSHVIPETASMAKFETSRGEFTVEQKSIVGLFKNHGGCDPDSIFWDSRSNEDGLASFALTEDMKNEKTIRCPTDHELVIVQSYSEDQFATQAADRIICETMQSSPKKWVYSHMGNSEKLGAACRRKLCDTCGKKALRCVGADCKAPTYRETECDYTCPSGRIQVNDQPATIGAPYCAGLDKYEWHFGGEKIQTATCVEEVDCRITSPLKCTPNCRSVHTKLDKVICKEDEDLQVSRGGSFVSVSHLSCNRSDGQWIIEDNDGRLASMEKGAEVKCEDWHRQPAAAVTTVSVVCAAFCICTLVIAVGWFILRNRSAKKGGYVKARLNSPVNPQPHLLDAKRSKSKSRSKSNSKSKSNGSTPGNINGLASAQQKTSGSRFRFNSKRKSGDSASASRTARPYVTREERKKRKEEEHQKNMNTVVDRLKGILRANVSERQSSSKAEKKFAKKAPEAAPAPQKQVANAKK